ncbi:MAG: sulfite exporter TauE/SafE family protein [Thermodesulfobacteriota bacterium]
MELTVVIVTVLAFVMSFVFALGGIGSALALVPVLHWYGLPLDLARPTGLLVNTLSMTGASVDNIRNRRLDFKMGVPIILASGLTAPLGVWATRLISHELVIYIFVSFLFFSALMLLFFKGRGGQDGYREDRPLLLPALIGGCAGLLSGLLGVGGGGLISPLLIMMGFNPKKVAAITAFVVPFSSIIAFTAYSLMGTVEWMILLPAALAAYAGGLLGTRFMHKKMKPGRVKKFLGVVLLVLALKMLTMV